MQIISPNTQHAALAGSPRHVCRLKGFRARAGGHEESEPQVTGQVTSRVTVPQWLGFRAGKEKTARQEALRSMKDPSQLSRGKGGRPLSEAAIMSC